MATDRHKNLKVGHINIRSILPKINIIRDYVYSHNFDVFAVTETWLTQQISSDLVGINGFRIMRRDRDRGRGGGVLLYVRDSLTVQPLNNIKSIHAEQIWIQFKVNSIKTTVCVLYKPPIHTNFNEFLDEFEYNISANLLNCASLLCVGDYNINLLSLDSAHTQQFLSLLEAYNLRQVVDEPTRPGASGASLLDLIICSNVDLLVNSGVDSSFHVSDHLLIKCELQVKISKNMPSFVTYRDFRSFNHNLFYEDLLKVPFHTILRLDDINNKIETFNSFIENLFDIHAPFRTARITKKKAPWITHNVKLSMKLRDRALSKFKRSKSAEDWEQYRQLRNYVTTAIQNEKKTYLQANLSRENTKNNWRLLRDLGVHSREVKSIPEHLGSEDDINHFFVDSVTPIAPDPDTMSYYLHNTKLNAGSFQFRLATSEEVHLALLSIKSRAVGTDGIGLSMLSLCCPHILPFVVHLINSCIESLTFPLAWKSSFLVPIPKVSAPAELKDLRPISILPTMSKVLERVMENQIREYCENYDLLPAVQSGFRRNYSCATALLKVTDDILEAADSGLLTALVLLDYSRAFDRLNHGLFLAILHFLGFEPQACQFLESYLSGRVQSVRSGNRLSSQLEVTCGVPQGSILGPLFFTLYTSQLVNCLQHATVHLYADDTQLYLPFKPEHIAEANNLLMSDLERLQRCSTNHCLGLNPSKCQVLLFGRAHARDHYRDLLRVSLNNETLSTSMVARNLGLLIDVDLRFSAHVNNCIRKAFANLKLIFNQRHLLDVNLKKNLCDSLVLSHFTFCDTLYGPCLLERDARRIQLIQNCCVRMIGGIRKYDRGVSVKMRELGWFDMRERRIFHSLLLYNKIIFQKCPPYLYQKIKFRYDAHALDLRHKCSITPPSHYTALYERSFSYQISKHYNVVPIHLKGASPQIFKRAIRPVIQLLSL